MSPSRPDQQNIRQLTKIRNQFGDNAARDKLQILHALGKTQSRTSGELKKLHSVLCYLRAFPDSTAHYHAAQDLLSCFDRDVSRLSASSRADLWDSGIIGTPVHYRFSFEVARWMARRMPGAVSIDWEELQDTSRLDDLIEHVLVPAETDYFFSGEVTTRKWVELAAAKTEGTDFDWLMAQLRPGRFESVWAQLYNAADIPLIWDLRGCVLAKSTNIAPVAAIIPRRQGLRRQVRNTKSEVTRKIDSLRSLSPRAGAKLLDVAMASLAARHRETYHFNFASPREVYLADVGAGVSIAIFGLQPEHRFPLECTMGFLILANGAPVGYGGSSIVFRQVNTGINIFDEYRGSEASFLWTQVMRVYHQLVGCNRYIANPFQVGSGNDEALQSGAFWFYYRLGYRPVLPNIRKLAQREAARKRVNRSYRSNLEVLRRLASCDLHFTLPGARASELFAERWLDTISMLATQQLAAAGGTTRAETVERLATTLAKDLQLRNWRSWSLAERQAYRRLAPIVAAAHPVKWPADAKRAMRQLLRAKGGNSEADYAQHLARHDCFRSELGRACRMAER